MKASLNTTTHDVTLTMTWDEWKVLPKGERTPYTLSRAEEAAVRQLFRDLDQPEGLRFVNPICGKPNCGGDHK